jgi:hypothetical protein
MAKRRTTDEFIKEAKEIHGGLFDYSKVDYKNNRTKVLIIDPEYGEFWQIPESHLKGHGSPKRANMAMSKSKAKTTKQFVIDAKKIHGDLYNYSKSDYQNARKKVIIICDKHGEFSQPPNAHLSGRGCQKCAGYHKTTAEFIEEAREVHGDLYDYSETDYIGYDVKVLIIDPEYGKFFQIPSNHLKGHGSPMRNGGVAITTDEFIKRAKKVHGDLYDYSNTNYIDAASKVQILDPEYGEFWQVADYHLQGNGNPMRMKNQKLSRDEFIERATKIHKDLYDYSNVLYKNIDTPILIIDPDYGEFYQRPEVHLRGSGHPSRGNNGFDINKPAILYYLKVKNGSAYKIGITGRSVKERFGSDMKYIKILKIWKFDLGKHAYLKEQEILNFLHILDKTCCVVEIQNYLIEMCWD